MRAANTGISAVIDPVGRIVKALPLGTEGVLDAPLPRPIEPTIYVRTGDSLAGLMLAGAAVMVIRRRFRRPSARARIVIGTTCELDENEVRLSCSRTAR